MVSVADPVAAGLVASLARPGGNVTGLSRETRELIGKTLQLLKEALPETARVDLLVNPTDPLSSSEVADAKAAAKSIGYYGMPNMAHAMLEHPDRRRRALAAMRTRLTIGLPEDIRMTMEAVAAREPCNVYGSTETYGNCAVTDAHDELALRLETQGRPLPGMATRVVDPQSGQTLTSAPELKARSPAAVSTMDRQLSRSSRSQSAASSA